MSSRNWKAATLLAAVGLGAGWSIAPSWTTSVISLENWGAARAKQVQFPAQDGWQEPREALKTSKNLGYFTAVVCTSRSHPESIALKESLIHLTREAERLGVIFTELTEEAHGERVRNLNVSVYPTVILYRRDARTDQMELVDAIQGQSDAIAVFKWLKAHPHPSDSKVRMVGVGPSAIVPTPRAKPAEQPQGPGIGIPTLNPSPGPRPELSATPDSVLAVPVPLPENLTEVSPNATNDAKIRMVPADEPPATPKSTTETLTRPEPIANPMPIPMAPPELVTQPERTPGATEILNQNKSEPEAAQQPRPVMQGLIPQNPAQPSPSLPQNSAVAPGHGIDDPRYQTPPHLVGRNQHLAETAPLTIPVPSPQAPVRAVQNPEVKHRSVLTRVFQKSHPSPTISMPAPVPAPAPNMVTTTPVTAAPQSGSLTIQQAPCPTGMVPAGTNEVPRCYIVQVPTNCVPDPNGQSAGPAMPQPQLFLEHAVPQPQHSGPVLQMAPAMTVNGWKTKSKKCWSLLGDKFSKFKQTPTLPMPTPPPLPLASPQNSIWP